MFLYKNLLSMGPLACRTVQKIDLHAPSLLQLISMSNFYDGPFFWGTTNIPTWFKFGTVDVYPKLLSWTNLDYKILEIKYFRYIKVYFRLESLYKKKGMWGNIGPLNVNALHQYNMSGCYYLAIFKIKKRLQMESDRKTIQSVNNYV